MVQSIKCLPQTCGDTHTHTTQSKSGIVVSHSGGTGQIQPWEASPHISASGHIPGSDFCLFLGPFHDGATQSQCLLSSWFSCCLLPCTEEERSSLPLYKRSLDRLKTTWGFILASRAAIFNISVRNQITKESRNPGLNLGDGKMRGLEVFKCSMFECEKRKLSIEKWLSSFLISHPKNLFPFIKNKVWW